MHQNLVTIPSHLPNDEKYRLIEAISLILILAGNALFLNFNAFRVFNFFDMGSFLDASWRVYQGQKPYVDFIYFTGPIHLYMNALFFCLFGFGKNAILAHIVTLGSIVIIITFLTARKFSSLTTAILSAILSATCFYWPISHPWYDQTAHLWGIIAIGIIMLRYSSTTLKQVKWVGFLVGFLCMFSFFTKSNIGVLYGSAFLITFLACPMRLAVTRSYFLGIAAGAIVNLTITQSPGLYYEQVFAEFGLINVNRLSFLLIPKNWFLGNYWAMPILVVIHTIIHKERSWFQLALFAGIILTAIISINSGGMIPQGNILLQGILMAMVFAIISKKSGCERTLAHNQAHQVLTFLASAYTILLIIIAVRYGFELKVWTYIGKSPIGNYAIKAQPLRGWMCEQKSGEDLDSMVQFINRNVAKQESLLVLSDMQILYSLTQKESYRKIPFIFTQGKVPTPGKQVKEVRNQIMANPPDWIVTHLSYAFNITYLIQYLDLFDFLHANYTPVQKWNQYVMLKKKPVQK